MAHETKNNQTDDLNISLVDKESKLDAKTDDDSAQVININLNLNKVDLMKTNNDITKKTPSGILFISLDTCTIAYLFGRGFVTLHMFLKSYIAVIDCSCACPRHCPKGWICGTDGKPYCNKCYLKCHACKFGKSDLKVDIDGNCTNGNFI